MSLLRNFMANAVLVGAFGLACAGTGDAAGERQTRSGARQPMQAVKIRIVAEGAVLTATLDDNPTARDFAALLPLQLTLEDYAATEKISDLPRRLSVAEAPAGTTPSAGDIAYYAPWGNLALFHQPFRYSEGLVRLGRIDAGVEILRRPGRLAVTIERVEE